MNVAYEVSIPVVVLICLLILALLRGDLVETWFRICGVQFFLRYRRNRRK